MRERAGEESRRGKRQYGGARQLCGQWVRTAHAPQDSCGLQHDTCPPGVPDKYDLDFVQGALREKSRFVGMELKDRTRLGDP